MQNGGHCQPLLFDRSPSVAAFELKNVEAVKSYIDAHNVPCEWRSVSGCRTFWTDAVMQEAERQVAYLVEKAPDIARHVSILKDADELKKHRVDASAGCIGATLTAGAASLWPYKLVTHILENLIKGGKLNLQTSTPVTGITSSDSGTEHIVKTPRGSVIAETVILATNGYTSALLPEFSDLIVPVRGQMSALLPPKGSTILPDSYGMVAALGQPQNNDDYLIQRPYSDVPNPAGHLMFGGGRGEGTLPTVGMSDDSIIDQGSAAYLRRALLEILTLDGETEGLKELQAAAEWTGIMGFSRDNHPWVGKVPGRKGVWICGGYTGHGMPNGTLCGKAVVQMVAADKAGEDHSALQEQLVREGDLPRSYLVSEERMERARTWPTVAVQDKEGWHFNGVV